jgi:hypothetical protein
MSKTWHENYFEKMTHFIPDDPLYSIRHWGRGVGTDTLTLLVFQFKNTSNKIIIFIFQRGPGVENEHQIASVKYDYF